MSSIKFVLDLHPIYNMFETRLRETVGRQLNNRPHIESVANDFSDVRLKDRVSIEMVTNGFFDICLHLAGDAVKFFELGEQRLMLNPVGRIRQMTNPLLQDTFFDHIAEYVVDSEYFTEHAIATFVSNDVASLCVYVIDEILREVMAIVMQYPEGQMYFDSFNCTTNYDTLTDLIINRRANHTQDVVVCLGFE